MEIVKTNLEGLLVIKSKCIRDNRGHFFESWNKLEYKNIGLDIDFVQDNQSLSKKGVLRGLHFQHPPFAQGKLVRVIKGAVVDIAVDIRKDSPTYGEHYSIRLTEENNKILWVPPGFAHGFVSLEDNTIFSYKCTAYYDKDSEDSLFWADTDLSIDWGVDNPLVSKKDLLAGSFKNFTSPF